MSRDKRVAHEDAIEAVRVGYIVARDQKSFNRWQASRMRGQRPTKGLAQLVADQGGNVVRREFEFRN